MIVKSQIPSKKNFLATAGVAGPLCDSDAVRTVDSVGPAGGAPGPGGTGARGGVDSGRGGRHEQISTADHQDHYSGLISPAPARLWVRVITEDSR